jgi:2'-5' RNA ligase
MRMFLGIPLAPRASEALVHFTRELSAAGGDLRWSKPESWHITLQFLGQVYGAQYQCLLARLADITASPVPVRIEDADSLDRAGIFLARVTPTPELLALVQSITGATRHCGFVPEDRPYRPHITLARAKGRGSQRALTPLRNVLQGAKGKALDAIACSFLAGEFLLYESFTGAEGARYAVRARFPLSNG